jgi:DNA transformation protein and related proteins
MATRTPATGPIGRVVPPSAGFVDWCVELLAPLGTVRARAMFGGHGLYLDERFVAIVAGEVLYLKADAVSAPAFAAAGSAAFAYTAKGRSMTLGFWRAPSEAMDSPAGMAPWGRLALEAAGRAAAPRPRTTAAPRKRMAPRRAKRP